MTHRCIILILWKWVASSAAACHWLEPHCQAIQAGFRDSVLSSDCIAVIVEPELPVRTTFVDSDQGFSEDIEAVHLQKGAPHVKANLQHDARGALAARLAGCRRPRQGDAAQHADRVPKLRLQVRR